jgi:cytochrome b
VSTTSAFHVEGPAPASAAERILVWDAPVRVFHWLMVVCFAGAWITAESERWRLLHVTLGYTMAGLVVFRLLWGLCGTRHARFANFVRGPKTVWRYLGSLLRGQPEHHTGHNPAGAMAIIGLLGLAAAVTLSGWATYNEVWSGWPEELHEGIANAMMALIGLHVAGVIAASWTHRENLVGAMITGRKPGTPDEALRRAWHGVAALMIAAVLAFWWWQWQSPIGGAPVSDRSAAAARHPANDDD